MAKEDNVPNIILVTIRVLQVIQTLHFCKVGFYYTHSLEGEEFNFIILREKLGFDFPLYIFYVCFLGTNLENER